MEKREIIGGRGTKKKWEEIVCGKKEHNDRYPRHIILIAYWP